MDKGQCFIVMPITTPPHLVATYRDGEDHFKHVLECLLVPAVEKAGYKPLPPKAKGADLIHAEIIKNLETADAVLCDMSTLNPNVFFEFGIRTSLNKPVCLVKDELTTQVPFDAAIINYLQYNSSIDPWELPTLIDQVSEHIIESIRRSKGKNELWKYFGFNSEAQPSKSEEGDSDKLDLIMRKIDILRGGLYSNVEPSLPSLLPIDLDSDIHQYGPSSRKRFQQAVEFIENNLPKGITLKSIRPLATGEDIVLNYSGDLNMKVKMALTNYLRNTLRLKLIFNSDENEETQSSDPHR